MLGKIKAIFVGRCSHVSKLEFVLGVIVIILASYILAPNNWEPNAESYKNWSSAQIFRQTGGFPVFHHTPIYNIYLQFFLFFDYPFAVQLEHLITHLFAYTSIFLLLRQFLPTVPALVLTCAWIPTLWVVQGGSRILGMGLLAHYLRSGKRSNLNSRFFPVCLVAAALTDTAYIFFLVGHIIGAILVRNKSKDIHNNAKRYKWNIGTTLNLAMVALFVLTLLHPSRRVDHNVYGKNYPWAPISTKEIYSTVFMQVGNWHWVQRNIPEEDWIDQDWYFTCEKAFGESQNFFQAFVNRPNIVKANILQNIYKVGRLPYEFTFGLEFPFFPALLNVIWVLVPISMFLLFQYYNLSARIFAIITGSSAIIIALLPIFYSSRYVITLLPIGLMIVAQMGPIIRASLTLLKKLAFEGYKTKIVYRSRPNNIIYLPGILLIIVGLLANEWLLTVMFSEDGILSLSSKLIIWILDLSLIGTGILLIIKPNIYLSRIRVLTDGIRDYKKLQYSNRQSWFTLVLVLLVASCVRYSSEIQHGRGLDLYDLVKNPFLLEGRIAKVHRDLLASIDGTQTRILTPADHEDLWIKAFGYVNLDNVFSSLYLPPFNDLSGETQKFLNDLDVIWVSDSWSTPHYSQSTQEYLRYKLHLKQFLNDVVNNNTWSVEEISGYGKVYKNLRPSEY